MTSINRLAVGIGMIISFLSVSVYAQAAGSELNHFAVDGISFDYPAGYSVTDESTTETQQLIITRKGNSVQLTIVAMRRFTLRDELSEAIPTFTEPMVKNVATTLGQGKNSTERTPFQSQVGPKQAEGVRLRSKTRTGEVIWLRMSLRLVGLTFIRSDADEAVGSQLWQTVSSSLKVEPPVVGTKKVEPNETANTGSPLLNGKAIALPQPAYPALARAARVSGTVTVQVVIDEQGNVTKAHAVEGHPLLHSVCVAAAREAKFSPTFLEGEPVRVAGVIQYHFIAR